MSHLMYGYSVDMFLESLPSLNIYDLAGKLASHYKNNIIDEQDEDIIIGGIASEFFKGGELKVNFDIEKQPQIVKNAIGKLEEIKEVINMGCGKKKKGK